MHDEGLTQQLPAHELLELARQERGWTQRVLANRLGVGLSTYRAAEDGSNKSPKVFSRLNRAFNEETADRIHKVWIETWGTDDGRRYAHAEPIAPTIRSVERRETWLLVVKPNGTGRSFTSIDHAELTKKEGQLAVDFVRLFPEENNRGRTWSGRGRIWQDDELQILFHSTTDGGGSNGCLMLLQRTEEASRTKWYEGFEMRSIQVGKGREFDRRECEMYLPSDLPSRYMPAFAALDLDNTLFRGWSILEWLTSFHAQSLDNVDGVSERIADLRSAYLAEEIDHDSFAEQAGVAYKQLQELNDPASLIRSATAFAADAARLNLFFAFARPLIQNLRSRLIAPVIITGAPLELAVPVAKMLGVTEVFGYDSALGSQPQTGSSEGKMATVRQIAADSGRWLQFAAGDSSSDRKVVSVAPFGLVSKELARQDGEFDNRNRYLHFDLATSVNETISWVESTLPDLSDLPRSTNLPLT